MSQNAMGRKREKRCYEGKKTWGDGGEEEYILGRKVTGWPGKRENMGVLHTCISAKLPFYFLSTTVGVSFYLEFLLENSTNFNKFYFLFNLKVRLIKFYIFNNFSQ